MDERDTYRGIPGCPHGRAPARGKVDKKDLEGASNHMKPKVLKILY